MASLFQPIESKINRKLTDINGHSLVFCGSLAIGRDVWLFHPLGFKTSTARVDADDPAALKL
jgi:hypothetical protein